MPLRWRCKNCRRDHDRKLHGNDWAFLQETVIIIFHRDALHTQSPKEAQRRHREEAARVPDRDRLSFKGRSEITKAGDRAGD